MLQRFWRWVDDQPAVAPIDKDVLTGFNFCRDIVQAEDGRDIERPCQNRGVRSAAAQVRGDAEHILAAHACCVRRRKIMRNQNMGLGREKEMPWELCPVDCGLLAW